MTDSKYAGNGPIIEFTREQWTAFVEEVISGVESANGAVVVTSGGRTVEYPGRRVELVNWHVRERTTGVELHYTDREWTAFVQGAADHEFAFATVPSAAGAGT